MIKQIAGSMLVFLLIIFISGCHSTDENKFNLMNNSKVVEDKKLFTSNSTNAITTVLTPDTITSSNTNGDISLLDVKFININESLPEYIFKIYGDKGDGESAGANRIEVYRNSKSETFIQEITFPTTYAYNNKTYDNEQIGTVFEDINFDGYKDFRIQQFLPLGASIPYYYWLWDNNSSKFIQNKELEVVVSPLIDYEKKIIKSFIRDSALSSHENEYKFISEKLTLVGVVERVRDPDKNVWNVTVKKVFKNEMSIVREYDEELR